MSERAAALERTLRKNIPLTKAMGVRVVKADGQGVCLAAPLAPNINHHLTFFGGSAATLATLTAWALAEEKLKDDGLSAHLVIQRSQMEYLEPAAAEVEGECKAPPADEWERFVRTLRRRGKGRIELTVELRAAGKVVGSFTGSFVALAEK